MAIINRLGPLVIVALFGPAGMPAWAQAVPDDDDLEVVLPAPDHTPPPAQANEIVVKALRIRGEVETDLPPIATLDEAAIASYGASTIAELVAALAGQTGTGRGHGDGTPAFLLNGLRIASFREMRGIPPEAIRRVEILPEEVALKYGFRPDQRVVNFILKDTFRAVVDELQYSRPVRGGFVDWHNEATLARIDPHARINLTATYDRQSAETEAARHIIQPVPPAPGAPDPADFRTLLPATTSAAINATLARSLGTGAGLTVNVLLQRDSSDARNGINPTDTTTALLAATRTTTASVGLGLNLPVQRWQLAATLDANHAAASRTTDLARIAQSAQIRTITDSATALATLTGSLVRIAAGNVALTVKTGYALASVTGSRSGGDTRLRRGDAQAGFSLDVPLARRRTHGLGALGNLSLNLNAEVHGLSDFGTLVDLGTGLTWAPTARWTVVGTVIDTAAAPGLASLAAPLTVTPGVAVYDFVRGETVLALITSGGNPALRREAQRDLKVGSYWTLPFGGGNDNLVVEYFRNHGDHPSSPLPLLTGAVQTAYADRIARDGSGRIVAVNQTPVMLANARSARVRTTLNLAGAFGTPDPAMAGRTRMRGGGMMPMDGRGRWNLSLSHSYELANRAQLPGGTTLDQLRGDALTGTGVARHTVTLEAGGYRKGFGLRLNGAYAGSTRVTAATDSGPITFGALATVNLRLFADLGRMPGVVRQAAITKGMRLELSVTNLFDGQQTVTDGRGATPLRYQAGLIDPVGRLIKLELRKQF